MTESPVKLMISSSMLSSSIDDFRRDFVYARNFDAFPEGAPTHNSSL